MASKIDRSLSETFGVPIDDEEELESVDIQDGDEKPIDDIAFVREKLHSLLTDGTEAFQKLADIATDSEKPAAFGTLNEMLKSLSDISMKLVELEEKRQKLDKKETTAVQPIQGGQPTQITNNTVYVGTTADLARLFKESNIGETYDVEETTSNHQLP